MKQSETKNTSNINSNFVCEYCNFRCSKKGDYNRHIITRKHKLMCNETQKTSKIIKSYTCSKCNVLFNSRTTLWRHTKTCNGINTASNVITTELVMELITDNKEMKQIILDQNNTISKLVKNGIVTNNNITTHTNSHNKTFNLQFFLNDTCKNAMNIMDFVNNLQLQLDDLEKMGEIGYVNGMSNIIIKNLKDMDVTERPVHCTDAKREVLYVKDEDKWDKETSDKPKIRKAIKHVAHKNARLLQEFKEKHPDCTKSESKHSDTYTKLMVEAMGGKGSNDDEQESKIIKKVSKEITLDNLNVT
jgi:hypothetical protein